VTVTYLYGKADCVYEQWFSRELPAWNIPPALGNSHMTNLTVVKGLEANTSYLQELFSSFAK
jgi:hypothetical protein